MCAAGPSPERLAVLLLAAALGGCAGEKKVADARPVEPAPPPTAANAYGLMGCWYWSEARPETPLGRSSVTYCFGPEGRGNFAALDDSDGWDMSFRYTSSRAGALVMSYDYDPEKSREICVFRIADEKLTISECGRTLELDRACSSVVLKNDFVSCAEVARTH